MDSKVNVNTYYIKNNDTEFDLSFGSDDMAAGVKFNDKIEKKLKTHGKLILCIIMAIYPK